MAHFRLIAEYEDWSVKEYTGLSAALRMLWFYIAKRHGFKRVE